MITMQGSNAVIGDIEFSPVERRMMQVLSDGKPHLDKELHGCLNDDMGATSNVRPHITSIRKKLRPRGQSISCHSFEGKTYYQVVRFVDYE